MDVTERTARGDSVTSFLPIPFHLRLSGVQGAVNRSKSPNDATVLPRHCTGISSEAQQGLQIQVPVLPNRESPQGSEKSLLVNNVWFADTLHRKYTQGSPCAGTSLSLTEYGVYILMSSSHLNRINARYRDT
jgi:hypothetical protein